MKRWAWECLPTPPVPPTTRTNLLEDGTASETCVPAKPEDWVCSSFTPCVTLLPSSPQLLLAIKERPKPTRFGGGIGTVGGHLRALFWAFSREKGRRRMEREERLRAIGEGEEKKAVQNLKGWMACNGYRLHPWRKNLKPVKMVWKMWLMESGD